MRVMVLGCSGAVARLVVRRLLAAGHEVSGIDARPWHEPPEALALYRQDARHRATEELFRRHRPECVVHMATVSGLETGTSEERERINLGGTKAVFDRCERWGVGHVVFVGRHTFYGAGPELPLYHREDEPPQAVSSYPQLADLVAADLFASTALWRRPDATTTILRLVYTLGVSGSGTLAGFLRGRRVPMVMGFDPLFQFMHEEDAALAIARAVERRPRGVFNVAGPRPVPLSVVAREVSRPVVALPERLLALTLGHAGLPRLERGALSHVKYPIVVDGAAFASATGFSHQHDELTTLRTFAAAFPPDRPAAPVRIPAADPLKSADPVAR